MHNQRGSSLLLVIVLILILGVLSAGYVAISIFGTKSSVAQREHLQGQQIAQSIETALVKAIIQGHPALQALEQMAQRDYQAYTEALEAYNQAVKNASNEEEQDVKAPALPKLEDYVKSHYVTNGETTLPDGSQVTTRLEYHTTALDEEGSVVVASTVVKRQGETYTMKARLKKGTTPVPPPDEPGFGVCPDYALGLTGSKLQGSVRTPGGTMATINNLTIDYSNSLAGDLLGGKDLRFDQWGTQVGGNVQAEGNIDFTANCTVTGKVLAQGNVSCKGGGSFADIYAHGSITAPADVKFTAQNLYTNEAVELIQGHCQTITAQDNVTLTRCTVQDTVRSNKNVTVIQGQVGRIEAAGDVILHNCEVKGDVLAGGTIYITNPNKSSETSNVRVAGILHSAKGVVMRTNSSSFEGNSTGYSIIANEDIVIKGYSIQLKKAAWTGGDFSFTGGGSVGMDPQGSSLLCQGNVSYGSIALAGAVHCTGRVNGGLPANDSVASPAAPTISPVSLFTDEFKTPEIPRESCLIPPGSHKVEQAEYNKAGNRFIIDATEQDVFYVLHGKWNKDEVVLNSSNLTIKGGHRVFFILDHKDTKLRVEGTVGRSDQLFILANAPGTNLQLTGGAVLNAQVYLPDSQLILDSSATVNGIVTIKGITANNQSQQLTVNPMVANYSGLGILDQNSASGNGTLPPMENNETSGSEWSVVKYYA